MTTNKLEKDVRSIYEQMVSKDAVAEALAQNVHEQYRLSAKNLYNYMVLRSMDLRNMHDHLSDLGISSMRTPEGYVFTKVSNVLKLLNSAGGEPPVADSEIKAISYNQSKKLLRKHANQLFNTTRKKHFTEIMVTMPEAAAESERLIEELALEGMEIARINMGRGSKKLWKGIIANIHRVNEKLKKPIKIYLDLAGPKIRTGKIEIISRKGKVKNFIKIKEGDHLILSKRKTKGQKAKYDVKNEMIQPAEVCIQIPEVIDDLKIGDAVFFDDGMIEAVVISKKEEAVELVIKKAFKKKISSDKGINFPETKINLPSLTERDIELLPFAIKHADILGYSFVRNPEDVQNLYEELHKLGNPDIGIVYKIETREAFEQLPLILLEAMKHPRIGVMIARGDLAVEIGFDRISEVQNQILWLCEAAHVPVIWATQVLENLAKTGIPTRAEISDAAMSCNAECVMLNKGPYILKAVRKLKNILIKMEAHSFKKKNALRALNVAKATLATIESKNLQTA